VPQTFEALATVILALVPGAAFLWGMEGRTGAWGIKATDRLYRFVAFSVLFHVLISPLTYYLWVRYIHSGYIQAGRPLPWWLYELAILYLVLPFLIGLAVGTAVRNQRPWAQRLIGYHASAPRAFDYVFSGKRGGYVRLRLKEDNAIWIVGGWGTRQDGRTSYVSLYPEEAADIFLATTFACNPATGEFLRTPEGGLIREDAGTLVRWDEVQYLEFIER
jgi:Family of unknown function (DUF6338)